MVKQGLLLALLTKVNICSAEGWLEVMVLGTLGQLWLWIAGDRIIKLKHNKYDVEYIIHNKKD